MSDEHASNNGVEPPYQKMINAFVNPLAFHEVDRPWTKQGDSIPSAEAILRFLCPPDMDSDTDSIAWRYREISVEKSRIFAVPRQTISIEWCGPSASLRALTRPGIISRP